MGATRIALLEYGRADLCCLLKQAAKRGTIFVPHHTKAEMAEALIGYLAWSALRLTSSLITAGFKKLVGSDEDPAMVKWSDDVVLTARNKQQQALSRRLSPDMSPSSRALAARQHEVCASERRVRSGLQVLCHTPID